jgi:hypothetical protein
VVSGISEIIAEHAVGADSDAWYFYVGESF